MRPNSPQLLANLESSKAVQIYIFKIETFLVHEQRHGQTVQHVPGSIAARDVHYGPSVRRRDLMILDMKELKPIRASQHVKERVNDGIFYHHAADRGSGFTTRPIYDDDLR
jgi:hypothetical protein